MYTLTRDLIHRDFVANSALSAAAYMYQQNIPKIAMSILVCYVLCGSVFHKFCDLFIEYIDGKFQNEKKKRLNA